MSFEMYMLKTPIVYKFQRFVEVINSAFGVFVKDIKDCDKAILAGIFKKMYNVDWSSNCVYLKVNEETIFSEPDYLNRNVIIKIIITGYKLDSYKTPTPVWRLVEVSLQ